MKRHLSKSGFTVAPQKDDGQPAVKGEYRDQGPVGPASSRGEGYKKLSIPVKKYESVVFEKLVEFVHCGNVNITEETVIDSSSGYDSSDVSDAESVTSVESRDSHSNLASFCRPEQEVMNFRSTSSLCANLRLILQMPDLCDVTFLVGPRDVPVHGVRAILGTRSCIFYQLILKHQALLNNPTHPTTTRHTNDRRPAGPNTTRGQGPVAPNTTRGQGPVGPASSRGQGYKKLSIPVKKYEPVVFEKLVEFVHCGNVNITEETVIGLYCGAAQFQLADLSAACQDFVWRCLQGGRADNLLAFAERNSHHKAAHPLLEKIHSFRDDGKTDKAEIPPRDLLD